MTDLVYHKRGRLAHALPRPRRRNALTPRNHTAPGNFPLMPGNVGARQVEVLFARSTRQGRCPIAHPGIEAVCYLLEGAAPSDVAGREIRDRSRAGLLLPGRRDARVSRHQRTRPRSWSSTRLLTRENAGLLLEGDAALVTGAGNGSSEAGLCADCMRGRISRRPSRGRPVAPGGACSSPRTRSAVSHGLDLRFIAPARSGRKPDSADVSYEQWRVNARGHLVPLFYSQISRQCSRRA